MSEIGTHTFTTPRAVDVWFDGGWRDGMLQGVQGVHPVVRLLIGEFGIPSDVLFNWFDIRERTIEFNENAEGMEWGCPTCESVNEVEYGFTDEWVICPDCKSAFEVRESA